MTSRCIQYLDLIERDITGKSAQERLAVRQQRAAPILAALDNWMREKQQRISAKGETASALNYALERWQALSRYASDGRLAVDNNPTERSQCRTKSDS